MNRLTSYVVRAVQARLRSRAGAAGAAVAHAFRPFTTAERALPIAVASIVAVAALLAFLPSTPQGAVGGVQGEGAGVRIAVNGGIQRTTPAVTADDEDVAAATADGLSGTEREARAGLAAAPKPSFSVVTLPPDVAIQSVASETRIPDSELQAADSATQTAEEEDVPAGPVMDDGTLLTGYAPLTTVEDGADLIETYKVRKGDTLASIAKKFSVSKATLWWANKLKSTDVKAGRTLRIPPVSGLVYTVSTTDTLETLAAKHKIKPEKIVELNGLEDPTLVVGQVLVLPGAKGAPMPKPTPKVVSRSTPASSGGGAVSGLGGSYSGGSFRWPVVGGDNYVSQYYHYGHYGLDVAADYGSKVVAAAGGKVTFAGWKSNGGGYQVWISHGGGLNTTYNHMSGVSVGRGQTVAKGQQVGRIGSSGWATGPHLHFEVWKGPIWNGGTRVNPLRYY